MKKAVSHIKQLQKHSPQSILDTEVSAALPERARDANKGNFGRVLIVGGGIGMPGAARLAGEACLRVGAGLVAVATTLENAAAIVAGRPELIGLPVLDADALRAAMARMSVVAIGPGLGQGAWAREMLATVSATDQPLVLDADALNLLAAATAQLRPRCHPGGWVLTPHPAEAGRLLGVSTEQIQQDRLQALEALVEKYRCTVVLKGAGTLVGAPGKIPAICERGNPGMASAGMGDVLTGVIAGLLAQCHDTWLATRVAVLVHAMAGDAAARDGPRGLIASDVIAQLRRCVNP